MHVELEPLAARPLDLGQWGGVAPVYKRTKEAGIMDLMTVLIFAAAAMAVVSLAGGIASMAHGGDSDALHSHELMFRRTAWQGLAVVLLMLALLTTTST
jgi:hypothetical protein